MKRQAFDQTHDGSTSVPYATGTIRPLAGRLVRRSPIGVGIVVTFALFWTVIQWGQASSEQGVDPPRPSKDVPMAVQGDVPSPRFASADQIKKAESESPIPAEPAHGPALTAPEELIALFQQRKQDLERRENAVRTAEGQLALLKAEVEQILTKIEASEKRRLGQEKATLDQQASQGKQVVDVRAQQQAQLAKMYESMPAEEAAARIERMADRKAVEILRLIKGKSAGAILAQVKVDRAAKLTEELLVPH
jgi:flagellar motility protein MotE (MotC chaperone)